MDEKEKEDLNKVEQLRNRRRELRNGDRGVSQTGENIGGYGDRTIGEAGYRLSDNGRSDEGIKRDIEHLAAVDRKFGNYQRGFTQVSGRIGRPTGRPGESDSGPVDLAETEQSGARQAGSLETDDPVPPRIEEPDFEFEEGEVSLAKPVEKEGVKQPGFGEKYFKREASKLSQKEVVELFEPLKQALQDDFGYLDEGIWLYCMSEDRQPIWGNIDDDEVSVLARLMLKQGQKNAEVAASVRILVDSDIYIQVAAIVAPRAIRTYQMLKGSPRPRLRQMQREARIAAGKGGRPV